MTIGLVSNAAWGIKLLRTDLLKFLISEGHQVTALCEVDHSVLYLRACGIRVIRWRVSRRSMNGLGEFFAILRLRRRLASLAPDLVLNFTPKGVIYGSIAARLIRQPNVFSVITGLGYIFSGLGIRKAVLRTIVLRVYRYALTHNSKVFFQNVDDERLFLTSKVVAPRISSRVNGSGVDLQRFAPSRRPVATDETRFLMIARLIRDKGVMEYLRAAAILHAKGYKIRATLLGQFDDNPAGINPNILRIYEDSGIVYYAGVTADVRPYVDNADVFVLPSYYREGVPRAALEALAMAKPIITTDNPGCREVVVHGVNGYHVPERNVPALAEAMRRFVRNPHIVNSMGAQSRALAEANYDVDKINRQMWQEIDRVVHPAPK